MLLRDLQPASDVELARELLALQRAAYAVEAALLGDDRIPTLKETLDELRQAPLLWLGAFVDDRVVGAIAWEETAEELDINRLMVAPSAHRTGVGMALVGQLLGRAGTRRSTVATGRGNAPARALYERLGFSHISDEEAIPGLWVARYVHLP